MKKTNILLTSKKPKAYLNYLINELDDSYELIIPKNYTEEGILEHIGEADILLGDFLTESMLKKNIKLIQIPHAGIERVDLSLCEGLDVIVCNSHSNSLAVAEFAVGLMMSISKKIPYHDKLLRKGDWNRTQYQDTAEKLSMNGSYIYGKTVGFIGYGNIGRKISKLLRGFDCRYMAIVNDKNKNYEELEFIGDYEDLDYVLSEVDYLFVAAPLTDKTRGMLNKGNLSKMKSSSYIINISRGKIIDEGSLYYILKNNLIRGAALDVWYNYPIEDEITEASKNFKFQELNNIIMSPHRADLIYDEMPFLDDAIANIKALNSGEEFINVLNFSRDY